MQDAAIPIPTRLLLIDADSLTNADTAPVKRQIEVVIGHGGTALIALGRGEETLQAVNALLSAPVALTARQATMLVPKSADIWTQPLGLPDLYFAEDAVDNQILKHGLTGPFVAQGRTLLEAANNDWSLFNAGEAVKTGTLAVRLFSNSNAILHEIDSAVSPPSAKTP